jgi:hypothetical protein
MDYGIQEVRSWDWTFKSYGKERRSQGPDHDGLSKYPKMLAVVLTLARNGLPNWKCLYNGAKLIDKELILRDKTTDPQTFASEAASYQKLMAEHIYEMKKNRRTPHPDSGIRQLIDIIDVCFIGSNVSNDSVSVDNLVAPPKPDAESEATPTRPTTPSEPTLPIGEPVPPGFPDLDDALHADSDDNSQNARSCSDGDQGMVSSLMFHLILDKHERPKNQSNIDCIRLNVLILRNWRCVLPTLTTSLWFLGMLYIDLN